MAQAPANYIRTPSKPERLGQWLFEQSRQWRTVLAFVLVGSLSFISICFNVELGKLSADARLEHAEIYHANRLGLVIAIRNESALKNVFAVLKAKAFTKRTRLTQIYTHRLHPLKYPNGYTLIEGINRSYLNLVRAAQ